MLTTVTPPTNILRLPYKFDPRDYQLPVLKALDQYHFKRIIQVWHRRSGKDKADFNYMIKEAQRVVGQYYYFAPTYEQGRKIIWDNIDNDGFRMLDHIPKELIKRIDSTRMIIELHCGSIIQVIGTEDPNKLVGTNPRGCVFTEFSLQNPAVLDFIMPILMANDGWAIFNFTPRGKNHAFDLLQYAKKHPTEWWWEILTADDTKFLSQKALQSEKDRLFQKYKDYALFNQEYYCSFDAPVQGSYYGQWILEAEDQKRITKVPYNPDLPVNTAWDLGIGDSTAIWFYQQAGREVYFIDYMEMSGAGMNYYIKELRNKPYVYGEHYAPHDIEVREFSTGKTRKEIAHALGFEFLVTPKLTLEDGIESVRRVFNRCYFDEEKCERGINALKSYQKEYDEKAADYKNHPLHNWSSHGSDAFRYFAINYNAVVDISELPDDAGTMFRQGGFY
jgi:phage terminase large subunit